MTAILSLVFMLLTPLCILVNGEGSRLATSECTVWAWWTAAAAYGYLTAFCGMGYFRGGKKRGDEVTTTKLTAAIAPTGQNKVMYV